MYFAHLLSTEQTHMDLHCCTLTCTHKITSEMGYTASFQVRRLYVVKCNRHKVMDWLRTSDGEGVHKTNEGTRTPVSPSY